MEENGMNPEMQNAPETEAAAETVNAAPEAKAKLSFIEKLKKHKKPLIGIGAAALAVIVAVIVVSAVLSSPKIVFSNAINGAANGLLSRKEVAPIVSMLKHGSLELDSDTGRYEDSAVEVGGKIYFSNKSIFISDILYNNGEIALEGSAYIGLDYLYLESEKLFGGAYGVVAGDSESAFNDSILADEDGDYCLPEDTRTMYANYLRGYDEDIYNEMYKDSNKLMKQYKNKLQKLISKYGEFEKETTKMKVGGERMNVRVVTLTITKDALVEILEELYDYVESDTALENFFVEYSDFFEEAIIASGKFDEDFDAQEAYDDMLEGFEEAIDNLDSSKDETDYVIQVATPKSSSKLLKLSVTAVEDKDERELLVVDAGKDGVKKTDKLVFTKENDTYTYEIKADTMSAYKAELIHEYDSQYGDDYDYEKTLLSVDIDKKKDKIKLAFDDGDTVLKGGFESNFFQTSFAIDSITVGEDKFEKVDISVKINRFDFAFLSGDKLDSSEVMPIDELTVEELEEIGEKIYVEEDDDDDFDDFDW